MGFKTKFGLVFLEAIGSAQEGWGIKEIRIWDREVLQRVGQWAAEKEQGGTVFLIAPAAFM